MADKQAAPDRGAVIYKALWHAIIEQALQPGAKLPEDAIGEKFGASRTIVRAALARLAAEGLVELRRNRGAAVATPSWSEARDIFDVRIGLERLVVARLAGRLTREQIKQLKQHVDAEEAARGSNMPLSIRLATDFHIKLAEMTGNPVLARYVSEVASRCGLILARYSRPHSSDCAVSEHRALIAALSSNDVPAAMDLMDHHLDAVADRAMIFEHRLPERDIQEILAPYAKEAAQTKGKKASSRRT
ncbi:GntR family transcriptional regulator [Rhodopseudomonas palustris]|uniref:GntR family transcriptional regulator n=2 Tax=Rhodopseudomonas TaxID=1073 RepID=UPI0020CE9A05|nr:GntR family transcriptional regulator [Rhodopseudomonas palustris]MCP9627912.1 GntR family transcriptional regulator [Rhodopseudomonas palustris]